jgi:hypothetical protein
MKPQDLASHFEINAFVMIRYRDSEIFRKLESSIRKSLAAYGLRAVLAKDSAIDDDLLRNTLLHMENCQLGVAVVENLEDQGPSRNVDYELGLMEALGRRCLILKEARALPLPSDLSGRLYKPFDGKINKIASTIHRSIREWCEKDLGLQLQARPSPLDPAQKLIFDSNRLELGSRALAIHRAHSDVARQVARSGIPPILLFELRAFSKFPVGIDISVATIFGRAEFQYKVLLPATSGCICALMIPKEGEGPAAQGVRFPISQSANGAAEWRNGSLVFDFREITSAPFSIFALRINDDRQEAELGPAHLHVTNVKIYSFEGVAPASS